MAVITTAALVGLLSALGVGAYGYSAYETSKTEDLQRKLTKKTARSQRRAVSSLAESERARQGLERLGKGVDPELAQLLLALIGGGAGSESIPGGSKQRLETASTASAEDGSPGQVDASLSMMSGDPTLGARVRSGSQLPVDPISSVYGFTPGG